MANVGFVWSRSAHVAEGLIGGQLLSDMLDLVHSSALVDEICVVVAAAIDVDRVPYVQVKNSLNQR